MNEANELAVRDAVVGWRSLLRYKTTSAPSFDLSGVDDAINAIFSWVTDSTAEPLIMWVHDDDRTKTSFIAQVVAYLLAERRLLSATYFFDGNTDTNSLIPTLVHEFTLQDKFRDDLLIEISRVVDNNPVGLFKLTHREQLNRLLVKPVKAVSRSYQPDPRHQSQFNIILLHAFEDCNNEGRFQESFLHALLEALISIKNSKYPQRLLVIGKRNDHLEDFLIRKLSSISPVLQRPVQSQHWLKRDQDMNQKTVELDRREEEIWQSRLVVQERQQKMVEEHRRHTEECEGIKAECSKKVQEVAEKEKKMVEEHRRHTEVCEGIKAECSKKVQEVTEKEKKIAEREKIIQEREIQVREKEESVEQMSRDLKRDKLRIQQEKALQIKENENRVREEELRRAEVSPVSPVTVLENIQQPTRAPTSPTSIQSSWYTPDTIADSPIQELGIQEDARMISPASQVARSDRVIMCVSIQRPDST